jgi:stearoyl-CoA desaturase (delta-9 desaturase)
MTFIFKSSPWTISILQFIALVLSFIGIYVYDIGFIESITIFIFYFLYCGLGIGMMLHRYFSHRSFEISNKFLKIFLTSLAIFAGRGSPIGWVYIHRLHHGHADTNLDPHSPSHRGFKIFFPFLLKLDSINLRIVKDLLTTQHQFIDKWYLLFHIVFVSILFLLSPWLVFFVWALPISITNLAMDTSTIVNHIVGYRNFQTNDNSKNNLFFGYCTFGEGWHNNHHKYPQSATTQVRFWEIDVIGLFIKLLDKSKNTCTI